jgi:hypothetical protein
METHPVITSRRSLLVALGLALPAAALTTSGAIAATTTHTPHKAKPHHTAAASHRTTTRHAAAPHKTHTAQVHHTTAHKPTKAS